MLSSTINNLISDLKPRQKEVIVCRFGLQNNGRETLAGLGEKYGITRERVRQIESEALRKIKEEARKEHLNQILDRLFKHLNGLGGLQKEDLLIEELKNALNDEDLHFWHIKFLSEITDQPSYYVEDEDFHSFWYLNEEIIKNLKRFVNQLEKIASAKKEEMVAKGRFNDYLRQTAKQHKISELVGLNYLSVSRKFKTNPFGDFGLSNWEEINPKTMGSKTYLVIKKIGKPLHFREIAKEINKMSFDGKKALPQTIHNELIKDPRFVLVGRGIYGLKEQGYVPGTAKEIITHILKKEGSKTVNELIDAIAKQRILEKNTIILNLQNKKLFKKSLDGRYSVLRAK